MNTPSILVGTRKGLFVYRPNDSGQWSIAHSAFLGVQVPAVLHDPRDGSIYAALHHGHYGPKMHRSTDGGATWTEITAPAFPPKPDGEREVLCPMRKIPMPWNVEQIWCLAAGGADQPGRLWAGTIPGALFRSDDHGATWELVRGLWDRPEREKWCGGGYDYPGIHSICVDPRDSRRVYVGISCGGVWATEDDGATWENRARGMVFDFLPPEIGGDPDGQDPHCMVQCASQPDHFWVQHHCGIYRSTDTCRSWQPIAPVSPSAFGFAVAVHPADSNTAWFVPAVKDEVRIPVDGRLVVTRTHDGGATFETLNAGLPDEPCYDLIYRHGLDVDASGERLVFGSTTGSLWFSEDGGDSWETLSHHLPPVFIVRFTT
jgi:photosystem II stability/assembly factor-like uncharacterized protein